MPKFIQEFKEFAIKGSMIDIAIGVIIGTAFNAVVDTLVKKVMMPPLSLLTDGINFEKRKFILREAIMEGEETIQHQVAIEYGTLITVLINFLIIALCVFFVVKIMNRLRENHKTKEEEEEEVKEVTIPEDIQLLSDLKGLMEEQNNLLKDLRKDGK